MTVTAQYLCLTSAFLLIGFQLIAVPFVNSTLRFTSKFVPDAVPHHESGSASANTQFESFVKNIFRKVIFTAISIEFGSSPEWSWVANYADLNWDNMYESYEKKRDKGQEQELVRIKQKIQNCLDEVGFATAVSKNYCENELVHYLTKESALQIVAARAIAADMSHVAVGKISSINEQIFESPGREGILAKFFCPLLTLKYFFPPDPTLLMTLGVLVGLFIDGDLDSSFSLSQREFYVLETKKGNEGLQESVVDQYFNNIDINRNGQVSWFEFLLIPTCTMHVCFKNLNLPDAGAQPFAQQLKAGDRNKDGFLNMAELTASAKGLVLTTDENEDLVDMDDIFDLFDEDEDGKISYAEIDAVFKDVHLDPPPPPPPQAPSPQFNPGAAPVHAHAQATFIKHEWQRSY